MNEGRVELRAGIQVTVVSGFRDTLLGGEALTLAAFGSEPGCEQAPKDGRRPLSEDEEDLLFKCAGTDGVSIGLLELPAHLMKRWTELAAEISSGAAPAGAMSEAGYRDFVEAVLEFLRFKQVRLPAQCRCDAVVLSSRSSPLALHRPPRPERANDDCVAINVSAENANVVFCNVTRREMADAVLAREDDDSLPAKFFERHPDYAMVGIELMPRQGVLITGGGQLFADYFAGVSRPGAVLLIRAA